MKVIAVVIWGALAFYSLLCLWMPELRLYGKGTQKKLGLFASLGLAVFIWFPGLVVAGLATGLLDDESLSTVWIIFSLCMMILIIGSWIEQLSE